MGKGTKSSLNRSMTWNVGVIGGGYAGLSFARSFLNISQEMDDAIKVNVVVFERCRKSDIKKTTGTIKIANHSKMLNSIEDISSEDGVKTAVELIEIGRQGDSLLNSEYTIASSMRKWQDLLNDLINNRG